MTYCRQQGRREEHSTYSDRKCGLTSRDALSPPAKSDIAPTQPSKESETERWYYDSRIKRSFFRENLRPDLMTHVFYIFWIPFL